MHITDDIRRWVSFGMNLTWLSHKTDYPIDKLRHLLRNEKLPRPFGAKLKFYCDYDFFRIIDTEAKAYWLGFLMADGCVTDQGGVNVLLAGSEKGHLAKYKQALNAEHPIEERHDKIRSKGKVVRLQHNVKVRLHSKLMAADLMRLGMGPRKSFTLCFPTSDQVPDHLLHHFIRGYFDGDGTINHSRSKLGYDSWQFAIISTDAFVETLKQILLKKVRVDSWTIYPHPESRGMSYFSVRAVPDINRIRDYLYQDATVYLDRKHTKFAEMPRRYFSSLRDEIIETLAGRLQQEGLIRFTSLDVVRLFKSNRDTVFQPLKHLESTRVIRRVDNVGRMLVYQFT